MPGLREAQVSSKVQTFELIDSDVHNGFASRETLLAYLPKRWHVYYAQGMHNSGYSGTTMPPPRPSVWRADAWPSAGVPGSDVGLMREQLLDRYHIGKAILHPVNEVIFHKQWGAYGEALATAVNQWMDDEWLQADPRLFAAITVPAEDARRAAREIARAAANPRFVAVTLLVTTRAPLGDPQYWPIYEAAVEHGLPVAVHVGGFGAFGASFTVAGDPAYFVERHTNWSLSFAAQLVSIVHSGIFDHLPALRFVFEEGGLGWIPGLLWRMDRAWESMREDVPHLREPPSALVRRHFAFTTQPLHEAEDPDQIMPLFLQLDMDDQILYASDYPHHDFDDPDRAISPSRFPAELRRKVLALNADRLFGFSERRSPA